MAEPATDDSPPHPGPGDCGITSAVLANLVEAAPDGLLLVDHDGIIRHTNRRLEELFGYDRAELIGRPIEMLLPDGAHDAHRRHRERYRAEPEVRSMGSGLDLHGRRRDGSRIVVEVSLSPTEHEGRPAVIAAVRDVGDRVVADAHTRRIERLVDRAHEGVYLVDPLTARFTYVNAGAAVQSGYGRRALLSMSPLHLLPDMDEAILRRVLDRVSTRGRLTPIVTRLLRADGNDVPVELLVEWDESPDGSGVVAAMVRDLSERREHEEQLDDTREVLALVEDRERIARDLHDRVIQQLFAIGTSLQATLEQADGDTTRMRLGRSVDDIDRTIREIRAVIFELQPPGLAEPLRRRLLGAVRDTRSELGFEPSVRFTGSIDEVDEAAAAELLATLGDGLSNVARHARATAVEVVVGLGDDGQLRLEISDDGVGIPELFDDGSGLRAVADRARRRGGSWHIGNRPGRNGTRLVWQIPVGTD